LTLLGALKSELRDQVVNVGHIWDNPLLLYSFVYSLLLSTSLGLTGASEPSFKPSLPLSPTALSHQHVVGVDGWVRAPLPGP